MRIFEFSKLMAKLRLHQIVYLVILIVTVGAIGSRSLSRTLDDGLVSFGILVIIAVMSFVINDRLHYEDDIKSNRNRIHFASRFDVALSGGLFIIFNLTLAVINFSFPATLFAYLLLSNAILYGYTKANNQFPLFYLFRFLHGFLILLLLASLFDLRIVFFIITLAVFSGFLDLGVNITGDVRDMQFDQLVEKRTIPLLYGKTTSLLISLLVLVVAELFLITSGLSLPPWYLGLMLVPFLIYVILDRYITIDKYVHMIFHGYKVVKMILLISIFNFPLSPPILLTLFGVWMLSYLTYLG